MEERPTCKETGCDKPAKRVTGKTHRGGYRSKCSACEKRAETERNKSKPCEVEGCHSPRHQARRYCKVHCIRLYEHGDLLPEIPVASRATRDPNPTTPCGYLTAHERAYRTRGKASDYHCINCGQPAIHWAYRNGSPREQVGPVAGRPARWSPDPSDYDPMCHACHMRQDAAWRKEKAS